MPKYELTEEQVKFNLILIGRSDIKGNDAPAILQLAQALQKPISEPKEEKKDAKITDISKK